MKRCFKVQLSHRLYTIAQCVPQGSRIIDVGTDHAYIPIYLIKNHQVSACIATDIHKGPLEKAARNMKHHQVKCIDLRLTNGIQGIEAGEGDVMILAGMGGYLTIDILQQSLEVVKTMKKLILQPQQDIPCVRQFLHAQGFQIEDEYFVEEDEKYYTIITAVLGEEHYEKAYDYIYGKRLIEKKTETFKAYMLEKQAKLISLHEHVSKINSSYSQQRKEELEEELKMHKEVMTCIF